MIISRTILFGRQHVVVRLVCRTWILFSQTEFDMSKDSCDFRLRNEAANKQTNIQKIRGQFSRDRFRHFQERHKFSLEFPAARRAAQQCLFEIGQSSIVNAMA